MSTKVHDASLTNPHGEYQQATVVSSPSGTIIDACLTVIMSLPVAVRGLVVMTTVVMGALYLHGRYWPQPGAPAATVIRQTQLENPGAYTNGRPDPKHAGSDSNNPQNLEADHKAAEDGEAYKWHFNHQTEDNPPEVAIGPDSDPHNFITYRFFEKSDRCVFVKRRVDGVDLTQWVRDPKKHEHDYDRHARARAQSMDVSAPSFAVAVLFDNFMPVLSASTLPAESGAEGQGNNCVNPHPGEFKYWWGTPNDKCNSPMYRQFRDGCTHYQIYNRCANAWDARIFWTTCQSTHSS